MTYAMYELKMGGEHLVSFFLYNLSTPKQTYSCKQPEPTVNSRKNGLFASLALKPGGHIGVVVPYFL